MKSYVERIRAIDEHMLWNFWAAHPEQIPASWRRAAKALSDLVLAGGLYLGKRPEV